MCFPAADGWKALIGPLWAECAALKKKNGRVAGGCFKANSSSNPVKLFLLIS